MGNFALSLPTDVPWKLVAVSPDMMDDSACNGKFPFIWRSSLAISAFEPRRDDLPDFASDQATTLLKVTCTITGYQPSRGETADGYVSFADVPTEQLDTLFGEYFACYGALLNVAVFPKSGTKEGDSVRIGFSQYPAGLVLPNPLAQGAVSFNAPGKISQAIGQHASTSGNVTGLAAEEKLEIKIPKSTFASLSLSLAADSSVKIQVLNATTIIDTRALSASSAQEAHVEFPAATIDSVIVEVTSGSVLLLDLSIKAIELPISLIDFPHIVDFEPKVRDLYQTASETGEVLTASLSDVGTDKSFTNTKSTETGVDMRGTFTAPVGASGAKLEASAGLNHSWGSSTQDGRTVQTDSSRERRERMSTETTLSQMYNLLTGYHSGTNRATFLLLPRPNILQPTDRRSFVQGLRIIEGIQEFFLIVNRPRWMEALCVEAVLETAHFPEDIETVDVEPKYKESSETFTATAFADGKLANRETRRIEEFPSSTYTVSAGFVIDRTKGSTNHPGVEEIENRSNDQANESLKSYNFQPSSDAVVQVSGVISSGAAKQRDAEFERTYRVFTRSEQPRPSTGVQKVSTPVLITGRRLCACFRSSDGYLEILDTPHVQQKPTRPPGLPHIELPEWISEEREIQIDSSLVSSDIAEQTRMPAIKELTRKIQFALATSWRQARRNPFGTVGFLESNYFTERIAKLVPKGRLDQTLGKVAGVAPPLVTKLGSSLQIKQIVSMPLHALAAKADISVGEATALKRQLLGLRTRVKS